MEITAGMVKELRESTGAGMMDCKRALVETDGNMEKAVEELRKKGLATAAKKAGRIATEGLVEAYIHGGGRIGVMVEINVETDFAAKNQEFKDFCHDIAMQIAAHSPQYVRREEIPHEVIEKEKEIKIAKNILDGKNQAIAEKIVVGQMEKYFAEVCLLEQGFIKDPDKTVEQVLKEKISVIGENMNIRRFVRFERGEGLAKKEENFAEEVAKQVGK